MFDYNTLEIGLWCENKEFEEANFCYESVKESFFDDICGNDEFYTEGIVDKLKKPKKEESTKSAKIKKLIGANKKKIAIVAACAVAILAAVVILKKKGKTKEAEAAKKVGESLKASAEKLKEKNNEVEKVAKEAEKELSHAKLAAEYAEAQKKMEKAVGNAETVGSYVDSLVKKAQDSKKKFCAPAVIEQPKHIEKGSSELRNEAKAKEELSDYYQKRFLDTAKNSNDKMEKRLAPWRKKRKEMIEKYGSWKAVPKHIRRNINSRLKMATKRAKSEIWKAAEDQVRSNAANSDAANLYKKSWDVERVERHNNYVRAVNAMNERERSIH